MAKKTGRNKEKCKRYKTEVDLPARKDFKQVKRTELESYLIESKIRRLKARLDTFRIAYEPDADVAELRALLRPRLSNRKSRRNYRESTATLRQVLLNGSTIKNGHAGD